VLETSLLALNRGFGKSKADSMKPTIAFVLLLTALLYSGCESPGAAYVKQHPELSPQQRKIFLDKKVTDINAVKGLTKEQIRVALGEPTQFDNIEGVEAWVYIRSKSGPAGPVKELGNAGQLSAGSELGGMAPGQGSGGQNAGADRTTIFFDGDLAVRATIAYEQ
jgi:outer membrane protein assembly factor BamE (lipoprotein component of BamABCDE complex)